jgi:hypothetical protein
MLRHFPYWFESSGTRRSSCSMGGTRASDRNRRELARRATSARQGVVGPAIATGIDPDGLRIRTFVGGKVRQDYPVSDMSFSPRELVSRVSRGMTLVPGDVIACGTSLGAMPMRPGVAVEVTIEGIGALRQLPGGMTHSSGLPVEVEPSCKTDPLELAGRPLGNIGDKDDSPRHLECGNVLADIRA